jgi:hypothetical protein
MSEAMERVWEQVGRAAHEAWRRWRIEGGYPDHAFRPYGGIYSGICSICAPREPRALKTPGKSDHHEDMIDWDDLRPEKKTKYIVQGMAGWEARQGEVDMWSKATEFQGDKAAALEAERERAGLVREEMLKALSFLRSVILCNESLNDADNEWIDRIIREGVALAADPAREIRERTEEALAQPTGGVVPGDGC